MKIRIMWAIVVLSAALPLPIETHASGGAAHQSLRCADCHDARPVDGKPVDSAGGAREHMCIACHSAGGPSQIALAGAAFPSMSPAAANIVKRHASSGAVPEAMKQWMIQWYSARGLAYGDPAPAWYYDCSTCHSLHRAPYPNLLRFNMENGELCSLCHGGTYNTASDWQFSTARRVIYAPDHLGLVQGDGVTEVQAPPAPGDGDTVSGTVAFPLALFSGFHRSTGDIAYRISIPGSLFGSIDVNPADHLSWYLGAGAVSWDTGAEANGPYSVSITPYSPSTFVEALPVSFTVTVSNLTTEDRICALGTEISGANIGNKGIENSLLTKASNACAAVRGGNTSAVQGMLNALLREIEAQRGKHIAETAADALIAVINQLLVLL